MEPNKRKLLSGSEDSNLKTCAPTGSHDVTLDSTPKGYLKNPQELNEVLSNEYHLTATIANRSLSRRQLSLLLDVLNYQVVEHGANFSMFLAMYEIYFRLLGNNRSSEEINDSKIRLTISVTEILLGSLRDREFSLYSGEFLLVSTEIRNLVLPYLMSKRTYGSRFRSWRPEKYINIRAVPVSTLINRPPFKTERYSGYTKGYGESHGNAHKQHTKPSVELDGSDQPDKEERNLILRMTDPEHQKSNSLWIKFRNLFRKD